MQKPVPSRPGANCAECPACKVRSQRRFSNQGTQTDASFLAAEPATPTLPSRPTAKRYRVSQPQAAAGPCQQTSTPPAASALRDCAAPKKACDDRTASFPQRHGNLLSRLLLFSPTTPKRRAFGDRTGKARSKDVMWTTLPNELVGNIFSRLPESSKKAGRLVCLDWCAGVSASISKLGLSCGFSPPRMDPFSRPVRDAFPNVTDADLGYLGSVRVDSLREQLRKMPQLTTLHGTISFAVQGDTPKQILAAIREEQPRVTRLGLKMTSTCDEEDALDMMQAAAPQLTALDLSDCTVQWAEAIDSLQSLKSIESLGLKLDAASGEACMGVIAGMAGLTRLRVSARFQVTSPMLTALSRLTELREFELDADGNPEADVTLGAVLARLPKLQSLSFSAGRLPSAAQVHRLSVLQDLRSFASQTRHTPLTLQLLRSFPRLADLHICAWADAAMCAPELGQFSALKTLKLHVMNLTDATLGPSLAGLASLESLHLRRGPPITGQTLPLLQTLTHLWAEDCDQWSDAGMAVLATNLPSLVELKLGSQVITDAGVQALCLCRHLEVLHLKNSREIKNGDSFHALIADPETALPRLQSVELRKLRRTAGAAAHQAAAARPKALSVVKVCTH